MSTLKQYKIVILLVTAALFLLLLTNSAAEDFIYRNSYTTISVESGIYSLSFSAYSCKLILGVITSDRYADLDMLSKTVPSTFTLLKRASYSANFNRYSISESSYFVLFNNDTSCYYNALTCTVETESLESETSFNLPYGITRTFTNDFNYQNLVIKSQTNSTIIVNVSSSYSIEKPTSTPTLSNFKTSTMSAYETRTVSLNTFSGVPAFFYVNCRTLSGCPVFLSTEYGGSKDSLPSLIIGAIVGPILFIVIFTFIVILILVISIVVLLRLRGRILMAATSVSAMNTATATNTQPSYVSDQTTDETQPGIPQPYVTQSFGNQAYSKPVTSQPQQQYETITYQSQNPYYNPGVGAYPTNETEQQEPISGFDI